MWPKCERPTFTSSSVLFPPPYSFTLVPVNHVLSQMHRSGVSGQGQVRVALCTTLYM